MGFEIVRRVQPGCLLSSQHLAGPLESDLCVEFIAKWVSDVVQKQPTRTAYGEVSIHILIFWPTNYEPLKVLSLLFVVAVKL